MSSKQAKKSASSVNPVESLKELSGAIGKGTIDSMKDLGSGIFKQLLGISESAPEPQEKQQKGSESQSSPQEAQKQKKLQKEANLFSYSRHHEDVIVKDEIRKLVEQIRREIAYLRSADKSLLSEVKDIEALAINSLPENPGIYHVRFLEIVLRVLQSLRMKVGESRTWLQAMVSKKKKRGSLFAARSKKQGTQYSMSQELQITRNVQ